MFMFGLVAWAAMSMATAALASPPIAVLLPLLILAAAFEAVFALHVGVERIGRYLQVFYEEDDVLCEDTREDDGPSASGARPRASKKWESAAMAFGRPPRAIATDALFSAPFLIATVFNIAPLTVASPVAVEWIFVGGAHALFALRVASARAAAKRQRAIDLARFQELKAGR